MYCLCSGNTRLFEMDRNYNQNKTLVDAVAEAERCTQLFKGFTDDNFCIRQYEDENILETYNLKGESYEGLDPS